jgi:hypothetical protein
MKKLLLILILIFSSNSFAFDSDGLHPNKLVDQSQIDVWYKQNCTPTQSNSIFKTISKKAGDFNFEIKYIKGNDINEKSDEWYDPDCGFSSVTITKSNDGSFKGLIEYENGYVPKIVKVIKNSINEKYALISHFSGGTAGSYVNVISLQTGKEIGNPLQEVDFVDGRIKSKKWSYESYKSCRAEFYTYFEVTYINDKKVTNFIKDDYFPVGAVKDSKPLKVDSREDLKKECPKLDELIIKKISNMT